MNKMELTMMVEEGENGYYVGQIVEYPAALSQGKTIDELENNLKDALKLLLKEQKEQLNKEYKTRKVKKQKVIFSV